MRWVNRTRGATIVLSLLATLLVGCVAGERYGMGPGENAPDFYLNDLSGKEVSLKDYSGKVVLVNFWASWCNPCIAEMPAMERLYQRLKDRGFVILAIGIDDEVARLRAFRDQYGLTFPILVDSTGKVKKLYGVSGVPESFFIDRSGKLVIIPDPQDNSPVVRIVGPRDWDSATAQGRIAQLLEKGVK